MDARAQSLLIVASASGAVLTLGGIMVWQWLKRNRSKDGHHGHHHHHGGQQSMFSDVNVWLAYHYAPQSDYDNIPTTMKDTLDYPVRLAEICKKNKTVRMLKLTRVPLSHAAYVICFIELSYLFIHRMELFPEQWI